MSDTETINPPKNQAGLLKATVGGVYLDIVQHVTPPLAGYLNLHYPILGETLSFEVVVLAESLLAGALVRLTPNTLWDGIASVIMWTRLGFRKLFKAAHDPIP